MAGLEALLRARVSRAFKQRVDAYVQAQVQAGEAFNEGDVVRRAVKEYLDRVAPESESDFKRRADKLIRKMKDEKHRTHK